MKKFLAITCASLAALTLTAQDAAEKSAPRPTVASRGKITAANTVARVASPYVNGAPAIVKSLEIKKGQKVEKGKILATLEGLDKAMLAYKAAQVALESVKSECAIKILEVENALDEFKGTHAQNVYVLAEKSPPRSEREKINYEQTAILRQIKQTEAMLALVKKNAENAIERARVSEQEAELAIGDFHIAAPIAGEIIEVNVKPGEMVGAEGLCEIADTDKMYVEAEIYVSDIKRVAIGDDAECSPEALPSEILKGKVIEISRYVKSNRLFSQDPSEYADTKVINVKIALEDSSKVDKLIGSMARVRIFVKE